VVETLRFDAAPDLKRLFVAAAANGRFTGSSVAEVVAERRAVRVDPAAVADYAHLCGFGLGAHPPVTWPHLLGFPLQAVVMSRRDFPLTMVGLVHVENRITWTRPLEYGESLDVRVHAADLRPHRRGRLVDLVAEVTSGDEVVWRGVSTYLARGRGDDSAASDGPPDVDGLASRAVVRLRFAEDAGRRYASVSGDVNPIHLHALSARAFGFDRAIAHGMFSYARVLASLGPKVPAAGSSTVWFRKPVKLPSTTMLAVSDDARLAVLVPAKGSGEHLVTTVTDRYSVTGGGRATRRSPSRSRRVSPPARGGCQAP
jgi:acyl dehydratase